MSLPTVYTEATLKTYMQVVVKVTGSQLNFTDTDYAEAINDSLLAYGVTDIADATDIKKIRTLARREVLRMVIQAMAGSHAFTSDAYAYASSKVYDKAITMFNVASADAMTYDGNTAVISGVTHADDPYAAGFDYWET